MARRPHRSRSGRLLRWLALGVLVLIALLYYKPVRTYIERRHALAGRTAEVRGLRPEATTYAGAAVHLQELWVALRASLRSVLEHVTLADLASGTLPRSVRKLLSESEAWAPR